MCGLRAPLPPGDWFAVYASRQACFSLGIRLYRAPFSSAPCSFTHNSLLTAQRSSLLPTLHPTLSSLTLFKHSSMSVNMADLIVVSIALSLFITVLGFFQDVPSILTTCFCSSARRRSLCPHHSLRLPKGRHCHRPAC